MDMLTKSLVGIPIVVGVFNGICFANGLNLEEKLGGDTIFHASTLALAVNGLRLGYKKLGQDAESMESGLLIPIAYSFGSAAYSEYINALAFTVGNYFGG